MKSTYYYQNQFDSSEIQLQPFKNKNASAKTIIDLLLIFSTVCKMQGSTVSYAKYIQALTSLLCIYCTQQSRSPNHLDIDELDCSKLTRTHLATVMLTEMECMKNYYE